MAIETGQDVRYVMTAYAAVMREITPEMAIGVLHAAYPTVYPDAPRGEAYADALAAALAARVVARRTEKAP